MTRPSLSGLLGVTTALGLAVSSVQASTDFNNDGYDDVWQHRFSVTVSSFPLASDYDGDGYTNQAESVAGTDPRNSLDCLNITDAVLSGSNIQLSLKTLTGKLYTLESSAAPNGPTWTAEGSAITGNGSTQTFTVASGTGSKYYRVRAADKDTDGDGVSDWAEALMGTNPSLANSPSNASGGVASDSEVIRSMMSFTTSVITANAYEKESINARIRLTRTYGTMPLTLSMTGSGNTVATKGSADPSDYTFKNGSGAAISSTFTVPSGATTFDLQVVPVLDSLNEVPEMRRFTFRRISGSVTTPIGATQSIHVRDATNTAANRRLFVAYLGREGGAITTATGLATLLLNGDNTVGEVNSTFSNLTSAQSASHLHAAPATDSQASGPIVESLPLGQVTSHLYDVQAEAVASWATDQAALNALFSGYIYINVHTSNYGSGEIRGNLTLSSGSTEPPTPPAPPTYGSPQWPALAGAELDRDIVRFLSQATFGATPESIQEVKSLIAANGNNAISGYTAWINRQMNLTQTPSPSLTKLVQAADIEEFILRNNKPINAGNDPQFGGSSFSWNGTSRTWVASTIHNNNYPVQNNRRREWWTLVLQSQDQLRQRMALALSEIVVVSENDGTVRNYHYGLSQYWDMLAQNAFGNYRTILEEVTYHPIMGIYLSHLKNQKATGTISPDENYAREIMQLFSIGLVQRHLDGSLKLGTNGLPVSTYDQTDITELARVMTGLSFGQRHASVTGTPTYPNPSTQQIGTLGDNTSFFQGNGVRFWQGQWMNRMKMFDAYHDFNAKVLFNGKIGQKNIPARTNNTTPESEGNADVTDALNALAGNPSASSYDGHPNTPVFIARLLIQRFTTSNPSSGYLHRVATKYKDTKGNLGEVIKSILLDYEARTLSIAENTVTAGKGKEPILHFAAMMRALKCYTGTPLVNLTTMPVTFTTTQSPITTPYEMAEYSKFPANSVRFRFFDTQSSVMQSPQRPPSVFNWFLPDYVVPGPLAAAGLVAPELQVATESNVVNVINAHYNIIFASYPPTAKSGRGLDDYVNISQYQTGAGVQLAVPQYGVDKGYFSATQFNTATGQPNDINNQKDNLIPKWDEWIALYTTTYTTTLTAQYAPNPVPATPGTTQKQAAHAEAVKVIVDQCDALLSSGYLKAKFGSSASANPRKAIIDGLNLIAANNRHTSDATNFTNDARTRCRNALYLVVTTPQALVLK
ncbi:CHRD domain-containing protein [Roseimicrobium gellanilyticum]|uniref:CHRD domain-containing protein n=1 Tax=Roseimicrobium gellanilyticum TaxID=748857 RepID=A0A366HQ43_9BACT|nr:DUF1800 family protein [Roseimicrobium gellanilyticum]RBP45053.1 CHRD domain-containing protein [Roseimicrobium gellanilyticum]